jgi:hypothetical protein
MVVRLLASGHDILAGESAEMTDRGSSEKTLYLFVYQRDIKFKLTNGVIFFTFSWVNLRDETHAIQLTAYIVRICR